MKTLDILLYILNISYAVFYVCAIIEQGISYEGIYNDVPKFLTLDNYGRNACARRCLYHKSCYAFNYYKSSLVCELLGNRKNLFDNSLPDAEFSNISTWKLSNDVCYPNPCKEAEECSKTKNGGYFCRDASFCGSVKCKNDGECNSGISSFTCICVGGFLGTTCEHSACDSKPCINSGTCSVLPDEPGYNCTCTDGYYGQHCQYTPCSSAPCHNRGKCILTGSSYYCTCPSPFTGYYCENAPCSTATCVNGYCHPSQSKDICNCNSGYNGIMCDLEWFSGFYLINYRNSDYLPMGPFDAGSGYVAVVRITVLDTQKYADLFKIFDGTNASAPLLATRSGTNVGCDVIASGRFVFLLWTTDESIHTTTGWTFHLYKKPVIVR